MSMFNDISWGSKDNEQECELSAKLVSIYARRFSPGRWSFFGPGSEKKWFSTHESKPQGEWDRVAELMMIKFSESAHAFFSWFQGVIYCTCGHLLVESESSPNFHQWRLDALSIPHFVIKKGRRPRGARHGKTEAQKEHFVPTMRGGDVSKRNLKEFTIASNEIQHT